jgi:hypothetical protein
LVEDLLTSFLKNAVGLDLHERIVGLENLPKSHRLLVQPEVCAESIWVSWRTNIGIVSATGRYDAEQSRRTYSHVVMIEYWIPPDTHHASWWRADPLHPTDWTAGRG